MTPNVPIVLITNVPQMDIDTWLDILEDYKEYFEEKDIQTFLRHLGRYFENDLKALEVIKQYIDIEEVETTWKYFWEMDMKPKNPVQIFQSILLRRSEQATISFTKEIKKKMKPKRVKELTFEERLLKHLREKYKDKNKSS
jgi:hypothetical protein